MSVHIIQTTQRLPTSLEETWDFFSSPKNLKEITPTYMNFKILSNSNAEKMYAGQVITYHVHPILGIPLYWMTEITQVKENEYFIDEQRIGPYSLWHHQHHFKKIAGGVEMTDIVHYQLPLGILGDIAHALFVKRQLNDIFNFRYQLLEKKWGKQ